MTAATKKMFGVVVEAEPITERKLPWECGDRVGRIYRLAEKPGDRRLSAWDDILGVNAGTRYAVVKECDTGSSTIFASTLKEARALLVNRAI